MDYQDYYQTLGLPRTASQAEIKKAFRRLAREHHPDAKPGDSAAERRFKQVNEAHAVLSDPEKRKKYDMLGANWDAYSHADPGGAYAGGNPFAGFAGGGRSGQAGGVRYEFRTAGGGEFSDFFRTFFAADEAPAGSGRGRTAGGGPTFEEILGQMGIDDSLPRGGSRAGGTRTSARRTSPTAEAIAEIGLEEAFHGTTRRVDVDGKRLEVTIPRGADNGTRIKLSGQGPGGGDLVVVTRVRPHPVFTRRGADLERELPVTLNEALLGAEVPVTTLKGKVLLTIPPGTQNGRTFRLKGQGMPHLRGDGTGDLLAKTRVVLPTSLDPKAEQAARTFLDLLDQPDPR
ncbi:MAG TPA: J domain-containing protein [Candidatus Limnocylindrales bacterium]|nr:J domain-containing protein [Candidatus Limnocylindrales bacterium]